MLLLAVHAGRFSCANAYHTHQGMQDLHAVAELMTKHIITCSHEVKYLWTGVGERFEEVMRVFLSHKDLFVPGEAIGITPFLGGAENRTSRETTISPTGDEFCNYISLADTKAFNAWDFIDEHFPCREEELGILCSGKQFLTALGKGECFSIASVYELLPKERIAICRIHSGRLLERPIRV